MLVLEIAAGIVLGWLVISALRGLGHFINKHRLAAQAIFLFGIALGGASFTVYSGHSFGHPRPRAQTQSMPVWLG